MKTLKTAFLMLLLSLCLWCCKSDFLDAKPDKALLVPSTLDDFQALLDNAYGVMNLTPYLGEVCSDDFYMAPNSFQSYQQTEQNAYLWKDRLYSTPNATDWDIPYKQVFYSNVVLDGLSAVNEKKDTPAYRAIQGSALFHRAWALYHLAQQFAQPYNPDLASSLPGIPVRTQSHVTITSERGSLKQTYDQILSDLSEAVSLLPYKVTVPTRPSKTAAFAFLSRLHLIMRNYSMSKTYADSCLAAYSTLMDYNSLDPTKTYPMPRLYFTSNRHPEILFLTILVSNLYLGSGNNTIADSLLYQSYDANDLRKSIFFTGQRVFRGSYMGMKSFQFSGLATDEIYLIRAECSARMGNIEDSMADLNSLLAKRWKTGTYIPYGLMGQQEALELILQQRRKELLTRGVRWSDLRRLNLDQSSSRILRRTTDGKTYILLPGDKRYTLPIPDNEINASGIKQNDR